MAGRRGNGEGSIYYSDKLNRWVGQFTAGVKTNGMPNRKSVYGKTRKDVAEKITKALNEIKEHTFVDKSDITLIQLIEENIEDKFRANKTSATTYLRDKETIKTITNIENTIANKKIQKITEKDLKDFFSKITNYSNSNIDKIYSCINSAFKKAVYYNILHTNPLGNSFEVIKPKSSNPTKLVQALTIEEQKKLLSVLSDKEFNHKYRKIIILMLFTGMRVGEALALTSDNIDFDNNIIKIRNTLTKDKSGKVIIGNKTKTYQSVRDIQMLPLVKELLKDIKPKNEHNLIFYDNIKKEIITPTKVNCYLQRLAKKYDIAESIHNHMLRHTYATRCIESGMTAVVLAKKLGHKDVSITLNTYTSVFAKFEDTQDDRFIDYLAKEKLM